MRTIDGIEPRRRATLRRLLERRRRGLQARLRSLREVLPAMRSFVRDDEEQGLDNLAADLDVALVQMEAASLQSIFEALSHLEEGADGTCADCGGAISRARLEALPFAIRCVSCQAAHEERNALPVEVAEERAWPSQRSSTGTRRRQGRGHPAARHPGSWRRPGTPWKPLATEATRSR